MNIITIIRRVFSISSLPSGRIDRGTNAPQVLKIFKEWQNNAILEKSPQKSSSGLSENDDKFTLMGNFDSIYYPETLILISFK